MLAKILIANRGEIAVRVIRAARDLGVATVAVYSEADKDARHVKLADEAVHIGPAPSKESYLVQDRIIQAAKDTGADAIHPGYGFLSENAGFARRCAKEGITFIGPSPEAMAAMGDKVSAREYAIKAGVPVSPGSEGAITDVDAAIVRAKEIGFPVLLKASAGGGGIGMRIVEKAEDLRGEFEAATAQAESAFGVPDVFMEKFIVDPRHIEIQIIGDEHGNVVHLGERECSIQRRYQKLLEEAPSPALTEEMRRDIGEKSVKLAKAVGYTNAGTLEFLFKDGEFYFNEMNTRLQVEHPVTEMVTGIDLAKTQILVASGEKLPFTQEDVVMRGHALEARINAENPYFNFAPSPAKVEAYQPAAGPGVRVDDGIYAGFTIPQHYDSMVAKLITWGKDRDECMARMRRALDEFHVEGPVTNIPFHKKVLRDEAFLTGDIATTFIQKRGILEALDEEHKGLQRAALLEAAAVAAAIDAMPGGVRAVAHRQATPKMATEGTGSTGASPWALAGRRRGRW